MPCICLAGAQIMELRNLVSLADFCGRKSYKGSIMLAVAEVQIVYGMLGLLIGLVYLKIRDKMLV